jgi:DNA-3-methyladenine glycosylase
MTERNAIMYGPPGVAYVYLVYGMHDCLNVVTEPAGRPAAVLIRAVEPLTGMRAMRDARLERELARRRLDTAGRHRVIGRLAEVPDDRLASGPGSVTAAFDIDRSLSGLDLCASLGALRLEAAPVTDRSPRVRATARVGIAYAGAPWTTKRWRFIDATSPAISRGP